MPVNEKNGNGELLERGWRQMQGILDLELPQNRNKKWGLWIPLGIMGVALLIAALMYFPSSKANNVAPIEHANPQQSFAQTDQNVQTQSDEESLIRSPVKALDENKAEVDKQRIASSSATDLDDQEITPSSDPSVEPRSPDNVQLALVPRQSTLVAVQSTPVAVQSTHVSLQSVDDLNQQNTNTSDIAVLKNDIEIATQAGTEEAASTSNSKLASSTLSDDNANASSEGLRDQPEDVLFSEIDVIAPGSLVYHLAGQPIIPAATQIKPRVGLEVFGAPHFVSNVELQGIEAGALATVTLGRKWKLLGGASYGHYNNDGLLSLGGQKDLDRETFSVPVVADTSTFGNPVSNPEIDYNKIGYDTAQILSEKFNYLHFPVIAQYRIGRFISITAGIKTSYLLNAPSNKSLSSTPVNSSGVDVFDLNASQNYLVEENILRKWDIAPIVGLAFDFGRRMALDVQYQHGLIPYVDRPTESDRSDYHRSLSLGLRYRIF